MSGSSADNKLIATAIGAAAAGAALAVAAIRMSEKKEETHVGFKNVNDMRPNKASFIFDDPNTDIMVKRESEKNILLPHNFEEKMRRRVAARVAIEDQNQTPRQSVTVRVPATSANMGPGCKLVFLLSQRTFGFQCNYIYLTCMRLLFSLHHFTSSCF